MRVIAGSARSLPLKAPNGLGTRPTTDRIKETLFNILQPYVPGAVFVDLYSGSGAVGIEALSRGAKKSYFVENGKEPLECIVSNLKFTKLEDKGIVIKQDVVSALYNIYEKEVDIIFMDPPYDQKEEVRVFSVLKDMKYVTEDTLMIVEESLNADFSFLGEYGFEVVREKKYKTNQHVFIKKINNK